MNTNTTLLKSNQIDVGISPEGLHLVCEPAVKHLDLSAAGCPLHRARNRWLKRGFDIVGASLLLVGVMSWLLPILALLIKIDSKGGTFFRQVREGRDRKKFTCIKLRTMRTHFFENNLEPGKRTASITRIGKYLRKTRLDELPQVFNVLAGDMSLIGPRPHMLSDALHFQKLNDSYAQRHRIKPGITGWAQMHGYVGTVHSPADIHGRVAKDIDYINNWSLQLDFRIVILTLGAVLTPSRNGRKLTLRKFS